MSKITIEKATANDYKTIADIYNESISLGNATMEREFHNETHISAWEKKINDRERLYSLKENNIVIGWGVIKKYSDREGYKFACETAIYITDTKLRKGYGSKLKLFLIEEAKKMNYNHIVAKIFANNTASINYNLKIGYTIVGRQSRIGFLKGEWLDMVIMQYVMG